MASNRTYRYPPHVELLNRYLYDLAMGRISFLLVTMPPRHSKSESCSKYFPAWCVGALKKRVILTSYESSFAASWGRKARDILEEWGDPLYHVKVSHASAAADWWELEGGHGTMMTAGAGAAITGKGGDILICDDPLKNAQEAASQLMRDRLWEWYTSTFYTRREPGAGVLIIQTRWHTDDLAGRLLKAQGEGGDQWVHLNLAAIAEQHEQIAYGGMTFERTEGEALWPERFDIQALERIRSAVGSRVWSALYQQRPSPDAGFIWKREWFSQRYRELPTFEHVVLSVDSAFKTGVANDYTVIATWGRTRTDYYLIDVWRARVEFPELKRAIVDMTEKHHPNTVLIEDKASGQSVLQELRRETALPLLPWPVKTSKESRAAAVSPLGEAGKIWLPESAPWIADWIEEHIVFPNGEHDDQCVLPSTALPVISHDDIINCDKYHHGKELMSIKTADALREGDKVLTHLGNWKTITRVMEREYQGEIIAIKPQGGFEIVLTPEHPVLCVKRTGHGEFWKPRANGEPKWIPASEVSVGDSVLEAIDTLVEAPLPFDMSTFLSTEQMSATGKRSNAGLFLSRINVGDDTISFHNPRSHPITRFVPVNGDLCRLIGYYLAEGSCGRHSVGWSFHTKESMYHQDITDLLHRLFGTSPSRRTIGNSTVLSVSSLVLHGFFCHQFGRGAANKNIPQWLMHLQLPLQVELIKGMWRGDGCVIKQKGILCYVSSSRSLIAALRMLLYRLGIVSGLSIGRPNGLGESVIAGKLSKGSKPLYQIRVGGEYSSQLAALLGMTEPRSGLLNGRVTDRIVDGYVHRRVKMIDVREYDGPVFNYEVEEDHSYQTDSFLVHNCDTTSMGLEYLAHSSGAGALAYMSQMSAVVQQRAALLQPDLMGIPRFPQ